jgi:hypothetical protein
VVDDRLDARYSMARPLTGAGFDGKGSNLLAGTAAQITDKLKRYKEAGLTKPLLWPPFQNVPVAKTLDDLKRLKEAIMPKVDATQLGAQRGHARQPHRGTVRDGLLSHLRRVCS